MVEFPHRAASTVRGRRSEIPGSDLGLFAADAGRMKTCPQDLSPTSQEPSPNASRRPIRSPCTTVGRRLGRRVTTNSWGEVLGTGSGSPRAGQGASRKGCESPTERRKCRENKAKAAFLRAAAEREILHGREGVDGSSPSEGLKHLQICVFVACSGAAPEMIMEGSANPEFAGLFRSVRSSQRRNGNSEETARRGTNLPHEALEQHDVQGRRLTNPTAAARSRESAQKHAHQVCATERVLLDPQRGRDG